MNRNTIVAIVMAVCLLMAVPMMATTVGAQTADDGESTNETVDDGQTDDADDESDETNETDTGETNGTDTDDGDGTETNETDTNETDTDESDADADGENETEADAEPAFEYDVTLDNGTVTVSVGSNGSAVENATVALNGSDIGETDANGTLQFDLDNQSSIELSVTVDDETSSTTYDVVEGDLVAQSDNELEEEPQGPPTDMPDAAPEKVSTIHSLIQAFLNGEYEKLGPIVSEAVSNAGGNGPGNANADERAGNASNGNGNGNASDRADDRRNGNGAAADENRGNDRGTDADEREDRDDRDDRAASDRGNGNGNGESSNGNGNGNGQTNGNGAGNDRGNGGR